MSFKLCWTTFAGADQVLVPDATAAMKQYEKHFGSVVNLIIQDDKGKRVSYDDLVVLSLMAAK